MGATGTESLPVRLVQLENSQCAVTVAPEIGGRIIGIRLKASGNELLWRNQAVPLQPCSPGSPYDPHFFGGIDEVLPCDVPEEIDGIECPDHGELWTTALHAEGDSRTLLLHGILPLTGIRYTRRMELAADRAEIICHYTLCNPTARPRHFLWKIHAALPALPGDVVDCPARWAVPLDPDYSTCPSLSPFHWPSTGSRDKSRAIVADGTCEYLSLYDLTDGCIGWLSPTRGIALSYHFELDVFPCACLFQSFGGLDGHYTTVIGPATSASLLVSDAIARDRCATLAPGGSLTTTVRIVASMTSCVLANAGG